MQRPDVDTLACVNAECQLFRHTGANNLVTMLQFGTLSDELTKRNMEMFASEVMPHLRN